MTDPQPSLRPQSPSALPEVEPAPLLPRFSAFAADLCLVIFLAITLVQVVLPRLYPEEAQAFREHLQEVQEYQQATRDDEAATDSAPEPGDLVLDYFKVMQITALSTIFLFFFFSEWLSRGSSPGKLLFRLNVVLREAPDRAPPPLVSALRSLVKTSCFLLFPLLIVLFASVFFQSHRRALHDLLARTIVIRQPRIPDWRQQSPEIPPSNPEEPPFRSP